MKARDTRRAGRFIQSQLSPGRPATLSKSAFARSIGKCPAMVTKYIARGLPLKDGQVPVAEARQWLIDQGITISDRAVEPPKKRARPKPKRKKKAPVKKKPRKNAAVKAPPKPMGRPRKEVPKGEETMAEAARRKEIAVADKHELDLKQRQGALASVAEVNAFVAGMIIFARDILLRIPGELRDRLAKESEPAKCEALVQTEIDRSLDGLAEFKNVA